MSNPTTGGHSLKSAISNYIKDKKTEVSYAELSRDLKGFYGDYTVDIKSHNIVLWSGISLEAATALNELRAENKIQLIPSSVMTYLLDSDIIPSLPLVHSVPSSGYKKPHWAPVAFNWVGGEK